MSSSCNISPDDKFALRINEAAGLSPYKMGVIYINRASDNLMWRML
jgi:hypothetical protein